MPQSGAVGEPAPPASRGGGPCRPVDAVLGPLCWASLLLAWACCSCGIGKLTGRLSPASPGAGCLPSEMGRGGGGALRVLGPLPSGPRTSQSPSCEVLAAPETSSPLVTRRVPGQLVSRVLGPGRPPLPRGPHPAQPPSSSRASPPTFLAPHPPVRTGLWGQAAPQNRLFQPPRLAGLAQALGHWGCKLQGGGGGSRVRMASEACVSSQAAGMEVRAEPWATGSQTALSGAASLTQALKGQPLPRVGGTLGPPPSLQGPPPHKWPLWPSWACRRRAHLQVLRP